MTDTTAQGFNAAYYFMPRNARQLQTRIGAGDRGRIGVTDSTCFRTDPLRAQGLTAPLLEGCQVHRPRHKG
jgi:hypothetical protein